MDEFQVPINLNYQTEFGVSSYQKMTKKLEIVISLSWTVRKSNTRFRISAKYHVGPDASS